MIREYIEGHRFNEKAELEILGKKRKIVKGVICVDGIPRAYAAWGDSYTVAQKYFDTFLDSECVCVWPKNPNGTNPECLVHKDWPKLIQEVEPISGATFDLRFTETQG